jgi:hypothetical protein
MLQPPVGSKSSLPASLTRTRKDPLLGGSFHQINTKTSGMTPEGSNDDLFYELIFLLRYDEARDAPQGILEEVATNSRPSSSREYTIMLSVLKI